MFFTNAEVSSQGHIWSTAAYVTDFGEKRFLPFIPPDERVWTAKKSMNR
jgi:hypothetical protein